MVWDLVLVCSQASASLNLEQSPDVAGWAGEACYKDLIELGKTEPHPPLVNSAPEHQLEHLKKGTEKNIMLNHYLQIVFKN